jgi:GT2 family glycosyltransferase
MSRQFTISILACNNAALTHRCIASVLLHSRDYELVITDNGSTDNTGTDLRDLAETYPNVRVFTNATNEGFIEPNRRLFRFCATPYFVMLNNDTTVPAGWLDSLLAPFLNDPKCAITGVTGGILTGEGMGAGRGTEPDYIQGDCMMVDVAKVRAVEPELFHVELIGAYGEDSFLSLQIREAGYTIHDVAIPGYYHSGGATCVMVPQVREWHAHNLGVLKARFAHYLKTRTFK